MKNVVLRVLFWAPRILCIVFAVFMSIFAFDVFSMGTAPAESLLGFLTHLIPVFIIITVTIIAWRWEWTGSVLFFITALFFLITLWSEGELAAAFVLTVPLAIIGVLFLVNWSMYRKAPE